MNAHGQALATAYELPRWPFVAPPDLGAGERIRYPVVVAGGGLSGLTLALDLALRGVRAIVLDEDDTVGVKGASSRGICYAQKSLEIFECLGIGERIRQKAVAWSVGRTFAGDAEVYAFDLQDESASEQPPFVNLQQFYLEWYLVDRIVEVGNTELRWKTTVSAVEPREDHVVVACETPAGRYELEAEWLIDATGANSRIRGQLGLDPHPARSADRWCITDVRLAEPLPAERWTWISAPFNEGRCVWQHPMPDGVWRLDYQLGDGADAELASRPETVRERLRAQLGREVDFEIVWIGPYQYRDHLLDRFRAGRVLFVGDSAHVVSPFGARGGNNGIQDAWSLGWRLAVVLRGEAGDALLDQYDAERHAAAVENLRVCRRTARFLAPRTAAERRIRRATCQLARVHASARRLVNTGRMAQANAYPPSPWAPAGAVSVQNVADAGATVMQGLAAARDRFVAVAFGVDAERLHALRALGDAWPVVVREAAPDGPLARHLEAHVGTLVLVRPDAYVAARLVDPDPAALAAALARALGHGTAAVAGGAAPASAGAGP